MDEMSIGQLILALSLQQSEYSTDQQNLRNIVPNKVIAEQVVITLAPTHMRPRLLTSGDRIFVDEIVRSNLSKINVGKGQWD